MRAPSRHILVHKQLEPCHGEEKPLATRYPSVSACCVRPPMTTLSVRVFKESFEPFVALLAEHRVRHSMDMRSIAFMRDLEEGDM